jgi:polyisoprenoid-binding protein YceI
MKKLSAFIMMFSLATGLMAHEMNLDKSHTNVGFQVTHMVITKVNGQFNDYEVEFTFDPKDLETFNVEATIKVASIDTENDKRDEHLRSEDFFEVDKYPEMVFKSTKAVKTKEGYKAIGDLTIKDVTKEVELPFTVTGPVKGPWGNTRYGIEAKTTINRKDFNVLWNKTMDAGGLVVSDEVDIIINAQFIAVNELSKK